MNRLAHILVAVLLAGCAGGGEGSTLDTDRFVDVIVELRTAAIDLRHDPPAYDQRKESILADAGVTEEQLQAYVEHHGTDLAHMADVWRTVNTRMSEGEASVQ
jgi:hypothetical protein